MTQATAPHLKPGRVYRTSQLAAWSANAPRLAKRLVREGKLLPLAHGLYAHLAQSRFGPVPPEDAELMRAFLDDEPFVFSGPDRWNALGLGTTALHAMPTVYNTKRSGIFKFGRRQFILRRVAFPKKPSREWYVVDLFEHADQAASQPELLAQALAMRLKQGHFDRKKLKEMAEAYGSKKTLALILACLEAEPGSGPGRKGSRNWIARELK
jgi:hypothetical protein